MKMPPKAEKAETDSQKKAAAELRERQVWIGSFRTWESFEIGNEPFDASSEEYKIWNFFQDLVGGDSTRRIESIVIYGDGPGKKCTCGAEPEDQGKLKKPCACTGGTGIVTFLSKGGAVTLKARLKDHKRHDKGVTLVSGTGSVLTNEDGRIETCDECCYNQKQVKQVSKKPAPRATDKLHTIDEEMLEVEQIEAIKTLGMSILKPKDWQSIAKIAANCAGKDVSLGFGMLNAGLEETFKKNPQAYPNQSQLIEITRKGWVIIVEGGENVSSNILKFIEDLEKKGEIHEVEESQVKDENTDEEVVSKDDPLEDGNDNSERKGAEIEPTEVNVSKFLKRLEKTLINNPVEDIMRLKGEGLLSTIHERLMSQFRVVEDLFLSTSISSEVEDKFEARYDEADRKFKIAMIALSNGLELERSRSGATSTNKNSRKKSPKTSDVDHQLNLFENYVISFGEIRSEIELVIYDADVKNMKLDVQAVQKSMEPTGQKILKNIGEMADVAKEWLEIEDIEIDESRKKSLQECIKKYKKFQCDWQQLTLDIQRVDMMYKFNRKPFDGMASGLIKGQKAEIFWNQEGNRKFQNLLDWFEQLELKILNLLPQQDQKVDQVIGHLSPKIQALTKIQNFKTYEEIKTWLSAQYLDEDLILESWQREITSIKVSTKSEVVVYIEQIKGILRQIQTTAEGKEKLTRKLFAPENISLLITKILTPLEKPTGRNQYAKFMEEQWAPLAAEADKDGKDVKPEVILSKMQERLDIIKQISKVEIEASKDAASRFRIETGESNQGKKFAQLHQKAVLDGVKDPWEWAYKNMPDKKQYENGRNKN